MVMRLIFVFLFLVSSVEAEDKTYTNEDLLKYQSRSSSGVPKVAPNNFPSGKVEVIAPLKKVDPDPDQKVSISLSGCKTLGGGDNGSLSTTILRHSRSDKEICDSVGAGCQKCVVSGVVIK
jgi:hypothetical protein